MKIYNHKNGSYVSYDKEGFWYIVKLYKPSGELHDKIRCDDYRSSRYYVKSFNAIARNF